MRYRSCQRGCGLPRPRRGEPVAVGLCAELSRGADQISAKMPPATHPPPYEDCVTGPTYIEHSAMDTYPIMTEKEKTYPGRIGNATQMETSRCKTKCSGSADCLGYVETNQADKGAECWIIPKTKFPGGKVQMKAWKHGSTFIKQPDSPPKKGCGQPPEARTALPKTDFGPNIPAVTDLTTAELVSLTARRDSFLNKELREVAESKEDAASKVLVAKERKDKAAIWFKERKAKIIKQHNIKLMVKAERIKKQKIVDEMSSETRAERGVKTKQYQRERLEKSVANDKRAEAKKKELEFKASPEGKLVAEEQMNKAEAIYAKRDEEAEQYYAQEAIRANVSRTEEKLKQAAIAQNVSKALKLVEAYNNETRKNPGVNESIPVDSELYKTMRFLQDNYIPYR